MTRLHIAPERIAPGPRGHWLLGSVSAFQKNPVTFFEELHKNYGNVVRFYLGRKPFHLVVHPNDIKRIFVDHVNNYVKGDRYKILNDLIGNGLITSSGGFWQKQRKLISPMFHGARLSHFADIMTKATANMINTWQTKAAENKTIDALQEISKLTLEIIGRCLFNVNLSNESSAIYPALANALRLMMNRFTALYNIPVWFPRPDNISFLKSRRVIDKFVYELINSRRKNKRNHDDLLQMLLEVTDAETQEKMSDSQVRDEVMTFLLAGHDTTANALAWTIYLLAQNPHEIDQLRKEISETIGDRPPTFADFPKLKRSKMVFEEAMRLYPPAWFLSRSLVKADRLGGYDIPAGSYVFTSPYITQRSSEFWEDAEKFIPSRFEKITLEDRHRFIYFPFGGGMRLCLGNNFALMEGTIILTMIVQKFNWNLPSNSPITPVGHIMLKPSIGMPINLFSV